MAKQIDGFKIAAKAAAPKATMPILSQVMVSNGLARANNCDVEVIAPTDKADGAYNVRGELLAAAAPAEHYQTLLTPDAGMAESFYVGDIADHIANVESAISTEETRYYLNGVFMEFQRGLMLTSTDGHRMLHYAVKGFGEGVDLPAFILPRETAKILASIKGGEWSVKVFNGRHTRVAFMDSISGVRVISNVVEGSYPDYTRVIPRPDQAKQTIEGNAKACLDAVTQCAKYGKSKSRAMTVQGTRLTAAPPELVPLELAWPVNVDSKGWDPVRIGFNAAYIQQMLTIAARVKGAEFKISLQDNASPVRVDFPQTPGLVGVVMPLRV